MARYIDVDVAHAEIEKMQNELETNDDKLWRKNKPYYKGMAWARGVLNDIPTAAVAEVVWCKDCKWNKQRGASLALCGRGGFLIKPNDFFCADGEREGGDE